MKIIYAQFGRQNVFHKQSHRERILRVNASCSNKQKLVYNYCHVYAVFM